ncbi:DREPP plasma membrane polypeptide [Musa troglodytarum]|uniref:DREPP plasma membrane polypeptide n=1 Tax=Musa troglodytarum TaxID=320322 RepID=A0A9E7F4V8_9LILI|nr:DREPP plasma membrane polypeptide [Musa troglodytarum]
MVNYWKTKVLPKIKKVFDRNGKKAAAAEACKSFDESKTLVKQPTESGVKKKSAVVIKFIEELVKIEFPGSKPVSEAASKHGPALVSGPVIFIFEKVSTLLPAEAEPEPEPAAAVETTSKEITPEGVEETKKEEAEKAEEAPAPPAPAEEAPAPPEPAPEPAKA